MNTQMTEASSECPKCNTITDKMDTFFSRNCPHNICRSCFLATYKDRGPELPMKCYKHNCSAVMTRDDFVEQDTRMVDSETSARQTVLKVYNKTRLNFPEGEEGDDLYDKYLEDIEDMILVL